MNFIGCRVTAFRSLLPVLAFATLFAQSPPPSAPFEPPPDSVIRINVDLVQIDAVVTDHQGKPVSTLQAGDFRILQDGKPQDIRNFSYISAGPSAGAPGAAGALPSARALGVGAPPPAGNLRPEQVRRTLAFVVDDLGLSFESAAKLRNALKKFVDQQMLPGDLVAIVRTGAGMGALQQYTSDKRLLAAAIDHVQFNALGRAGVSAFEPIPARLDTADPGIQVHGYEMHASGTVGALAYVLGGLRELPGRKSVVLFSENLRFAPPYLIDRANRTSVVVNCIDPRGPQPVAVRAEDSPLQLTIQQIDAIHGQRASQVLDSREGLSALARDTGGLFLHTRIDDDLRRVLAASEGYYLIGYHPDASTFDTRDGKVSYHKIQVEVDRPGLTVRTRRGFLGSTGHDARPDSPPTRQAALERALDSPFGASDIHVRLTPFFTTSEKSASMVSGILYIDPADLTFADEPGGIHKAVIDVLARAFGDNGQAGNSSAHTYIGAMKEAEYQGVLKNGLFYNFLFEMKKPGAYQVRVAVRDSASGKLGSASQFMEVPDVGKGRLTLSTLAIESPAPRQPGYRGVHDPDVHSNPGFRVFRPGDTIAYGYQVLNAQVGDDRQVDLESRTHLYQEGREIYNGKPAKLSGGQSGARRLLIGGTMKLAAGLAPGHYFLQLVVNDKLAKEKYNTASQWIDFEVQ